MNKIKKLRVNSPRSFEFAQSLVDFNAFTIIKKYLKSSATYCISSIIYFTIKS